MALVRINCESRRRGVGKGKVLEQAGQWQKLMEYCIEQSVLYGAHEDAEQLRAQLNPQVPNALDTSEPVSTPEPEKPRRKQRKKPVTSSPAIRQRKAWNEVRARHER
jgi:hypothetical protein